MLSIEIGKAYLNKELYIDNAYITLNEESITTFTNDYGLVTKAMSFHNSYAVKYVIGHINVSQLSLKKRKDFFSKYIGIVQDKAVFIKNLNVLEHIQLQKTIFNSDDCNKWIDFLQLNHSLEKYPNQLDNFETTCLSILLAIIKNPKVLIIEDFNEKFEYLQTQIILNTLQSFCKKNKIIVISSNNEQVISQSDEVYEIANQQCICRKRNKNVSLKKQHSFDPVDINHKLFAKKLGSIKYKHNTFKIIAKAFLSLSLALLAFCTNYDQGDQKLELEFAKGIRYEGIYVYKPQEQQDASNFYSLIDPYKANKVITDEEIEGIYEIDHVESVEWTYDFMLDYPNPALEEFEASQTMIQLSNGEEINLLSTDEKGYSHDISASSYIPNKDYIEFINHKFQNEGVYLSTTLAKYLCGDKDVSILENSTISFDFYVPVYNSSGRIAYYSSYDNSKFYPMVPTIITERVTLPIAGIIEDMNNRYQEVLYFERDILEELINKYKVTESQTVYVLKDDKVVEQIPDDGQYVRTAYDEPWRPTGYVVYVDDVNYLSDVVEELINLGFYVSNATFNIEEDLIETKTISKTLFYSIIAICTIFSFFIHTMYMFVDFKTQKNLHLYLKNMYFSKKQIIQIKQNVHIYNTRKRIALAILSLLINIIVWNTILKWGYTDLSLSMFLVIIVLSILFEFLIPYLYDRATIFK